MREAVPDNKEPVRVYRLHAGTRRIHRASAEERPDGADQASPPLQDNGFKPPLPQIRKLDKGNSAIAAQRDMGQRHNLRRDSRGGVLPLANN